MRAAVLSSPQRLVVREVPPPEQLGCRPAEPVACAINAVDRAGVRPGDRVAVVGCGFLGLLLVALCAPMAGELAAVSRRGFALEIAAMLGAGGTWRAGDP